MTLTLLRFLLAASLLVGTASWSGATTMAGFGEADSRIAPGGPRGAFDLPAGLVLQPERSVKKGVSASGADVEPVPVRTEPPVAVSRTSGLPLPDRASAFNARPFLRPGTRAPPL